MEQFWSDLRLATRTLLRARGFSTAVIATLTFAIALETSVLAVMNAYLVRSLPYPAADRLYQIAYAGRNEPHPSGLADLDWSALGPVVEHRIAWDLDMFYLIGGDHPEAAPGAWVTPGFMHGLGIRPMMGRSFAPEEFEPGGPQVALISHALWQRRFGGRTDILGREFEAYVSDRPRDPDVFTIVGVLSPSFWHLNVFTDVLTPLRARTYPYLVTLRGGVPPAVAEQRIANLLREGLGTDAPSRAVRLRSVHEEYAKELRPMLVAVTASASLVLLIACANVAFLLLIRGLRRQKEVAVRLALGASRMQVARMLLTESLVLAAVAAALGTALGALLVRALAPIVEQQVGRRVPGGVSAVSVDGTVVAAVGAATLVIAMALTLAPLAVARRQALFSMMRRGKRGGAEGSRGRRTRLSLIAVELAGSLALLAGCALMIRTVGQMLAVDLGIRPAQVVVAGLTLRERTYPDAETRVAFYERLVAELGQTSTVSSVALTSLSPLTQPQPQPVSAGDGDSRAAGTAGVRAVTPEYFATLAIPLLQGRVLARSDRGTSEPVAVLSETTARRLWPDASALGRSVRVVEHGTDGDTVTATRTIVGVVKDVRQSPTDDQVAEVYVPLLQSPRRFVATVTRTTMAPEPWLAQLRRELRRLDPEISVSSARALEAVAEEQLARPRFLASLFAGFGLFASLLALVGVYGVVSYAVKQREHEVAVRIAVGADAPAIVRLFMREGVLVLSVGITAGLLGAFVIGRLLEAQLFGVRPADPVTLVAVSLGLGAACVVATWLPARRASATDPVIALRDE